MILRLRSDVASRLENTRRIQLPPLGLCIGCMFVRSLALWIRGGKSIGHECMIKGKRRCPIR